MRRVVGILVSASFEGVFVVLPGLVAGVIFLIALAGPWYVWGGVLVLFGLYVIVVEMLKDRIEDWFERTEE